MPDNERYVAFISYRHVEPDRDIAKWLHSALEGYRLPTALVAGGASLRLGRAFRDEEELAASSDLSQRIDAALQRADALIVICSPRVQTSRWVDAEVRRFTALGRSDRIFALLVEGEPADAFPPALLALGREPLAADLRASLGESARDRRRTALLKLAAGLLGIEFDVLRRREEERRRRRLAWIAASAAALSTVLAGLSVFAGLQWQRAESELAISRAQHLAAQAQIALAESERDKDCLTCPDIQRAALLALESLRTHPTLAADAVLRRTLWRLATQRMDRLVDGAWESLSIGDAGQLLGIDASTAAKVQAADAGGAVQSAADPDLLARSADGRLALRRAQGDASAWNFESGALDSASGRRIALLPHEWHINQAYFSGDGRWLTTVTGSASADASDPSATVLVGSTVRVWDTVSGEERTRLSLAAEGGILGVRIDASGTWLLTASNASALDEATNESNGTVRVRIWPLPPESLVRQGCASLTRNLSPSEWSTFVGTAAWRSTCPGLPAVSE